MKKLSILFLFFYVFTNTEMHELFKLPSMVKHYQEHQTTDGSIGFIHFLHIHYTNDHPHQDNDGDEEQLPFQDHHSIFTVVAPTKDLTSFTLKIEIENHQKIDIAIPNEDFHSSSFIDQIWQPPRNC